MEEAIEINRIRGGKSSLSGLANFIRKIGFWLDRFWYSQGEYERIQNHIQEIRLKYENYRFR